VSSRTDHVQIARVIGIPIYLHFSWLIIFGLIAWTLSTGYFPAQSPDLPASSYWAKGLVASLLFFVSILLHELGHAFVARRQGLRTLSITLFVFGGVRALAHGDPRAVPAVLSLAATGVGLMWALSPVLAGLALTETHDLSRLLHFPLPLSTLVTSSLVANLVQPMVLAELPVAVALGLAVSGSPALVPLAVLGVLSSLAFILVAAQCTGLLLHALSRNRRLQDLALFAGLCVYVWWTANRKDSEASS